MWSATARLTFNLPLLLITSEVCEVISQLISQQMTLWPSTSLETTLHRAVNACHLKWSDRAYILFSVSFYIAVIPSDPTALA